MIGQVLISAWNFVFYAALDLFIYTFVDLLTKGLLKDVQSDQERGQVWLGETISLSLLCALFWWISHKPVVLFILTIITLIYTQLVCRVDFGYWWSLVTIRWEEFQSVEQLQESSLMLDTSVPATQNNGPQQLAGPAAYPPSMVYYEGSEESDELPAEPWYPDEEKSSSQIPHNVNQHSPVSESCAFGRAAVTSINVQPVTPARPVIQTENNLHLRTASPSCSIAPVYVPSRPQQPNHVPNNMQPFIRSQSDYQMQTLTNNRISPGAPQMQHRNILPRRGIHSPVRNFPAKIVSNSASSMLKSRLLSALGFADAKEAPLGLRNGGQNLCFMNSVLQCLANSPSMVEHLYKENQTDPREAALTVAFRELIKQLSVLPGEVMDSTADTWKFRQAASSFNNSVVAHPSHGSQGQQDAAEFLMWLLQILHTALNSSTKCQVMNIQGAPSTPTPYNSMTLTILKFIYGDLNAEKIDRLKKTFKQEIEFSNSLAGESSDESIQRLADLEWLTYKQSNNSVINNLFTGQLIEAQRCVACDHISVNIQTFNILPVPIVEPNASGLVYLEDCFDKFGTIENLIGSNGLNCARCKSRRHVNYVKRDGGALVNSTLETIMSPIPKFRNMLNDSGFQDNQCRTSTPIRENVTSAQSKNKLTDGQKRSLLRQLPECLVIQLMRFTYEKGQVQKVHRRVSVPMVNLDLSRYTYQEGIASDTETLTYNLYAMCVHTGANSTSYGHYVTYAQARNGMWYKYDDENVSEVNMEYKLKTEEIGENAYLLFYKRNQLI